MIKTLGNHLRKVHGVMGATLMGDGEVVLILNPGELLRGTLRKTTKRIVPPTISVLHPAPVTIQPEELPDAIELEVPEAQTEADGDGALIR